MQCFHPPLYGRSIADTALNTIFNAFVQNATLSSLINLLDSASMHRDTHLGDILDQYTHVYLMTVHDKLIAFF